LYFRRGLADLLIAGFDADGQKYGERNGPQ
jgi:hypothetical protein